ncbi:uncharacterized protein LOC123392855 isoform X2 [Mustela putorius furo]|nr:uncharacterized protein LOC123392855 isoform X2 [Mustela putorius furo]
MEKNRYQLLQSLIDATFEDLWFWSFVGSVLITDSTSWLLERMQPPKLQRRLSTHGIFRTDKAFRKDAASEATEKAFYTWYFQDRQEMEKNRYQLLQSLIDATFEDLWFWSFVGSVLITDSTSWLLERMQPPKLQRRLSTHGIFRTDKAFRKDAASEATEKAFYTWYFQDRQEMEKNRYQLLQSLIDATFEDLWFWSFVGSVLITDSTSWLLERMQPPKLQRRLSTHGIFRTDKAFRKDAASEATEKAFYTWYFQDRQEMEKNRYQLLQSLIDATFEDLWFWSFVGSVLITDSTSWLVVFSKSFFFAVSVLGSSMFLQIYPFLLGYPVS